MRTLNDYFMYTGFGDVSTAETIYLPVPDGGRVIRLDVVISSAKTTDAVVKVTKGGVDVTGGSVTIVASGSAAGDVFTKEFSPNDGTADVSAGESIAVVTDGAGTGGGVASVVVVIRR